MTDNKWTLIEEFNRDIHTSPFFEVICPHGVGHHKGVHGCDGCCAEAPADMWDKVTED